MADVPNFLSNLDHVVGIIASMGVLILAGGKWIIARIEKGQSDLKNAITSQGRKHQKDFKRLRKELQHKVDIEECTKYREGCSACTINRGKESK